MTVSKIAPLADEGMVSQSRREGQVGGQVL